MCSFCGQEDCSEMMYDVVPRNHTAGSGLCTSDESGRDVCCWFVCLYYLVLLLFYYYDYFIFLLCCNKYKTPVLYTTVAVTSQTSSFPGPAPISFAFSPPRERGF